MLVGAPYAAWRWLRHHDKIGQHLSPACTETNQLANHRSLSRPTSPAAIYAVRRANQRFVLVMAQRDQADRPMVLDDMLASVLT